MKQEFEWSVQWFLKWGGITENQMNHEVAEVNASIPQTLPGSFFYKKEPGYDPGLFYTMWDTHTNTPTDWKLLVPTLVPQVTSVGRERG